VPECPFNIGGSINYHIETFTLSRPLSVNLRRESGIGSKFMCWGEEMAHEGDAVCMLLYFYSIIFIPFNQLEKIEKIFFCIFLPGGWRSKQEITLCPL
jgi:hypothetical protein